MSEGTKGAGLALDIYTAGEAAKAKQRMDIRNAKIAQQQRKLAFNRESQAYMHNVQRLKDQNTSENFNISIAEADARDRLVSSLAGSGIAGASVDELDTAITKEVSRDRISTNRSFESARDAANIERIQSNENRIIEAENAYVHDYSEDINAALYQSVGSMLMMK